MHACTGADNGLVGARRRALLALAFAAVASPALAQDATPTVQRSVVTGAITVTTKGISTIPSFSLGRPAAIVDLSVAKHGLSFEPQFKAGLDGKPWAISLWGRYRLFDGDKLHVLIGAHPALSFRSVSRVVNGESREVMEVRRYIATELSPSYTLSEHFGVAAYWLSSYGVEPDVVKHTNFIAARATVTSPLGGTYVVRLLPQMYYLKTDARDGYYVNGTVTLSRPDLPLSIMSSANKPLRTSVLGGGEFLWNVSLMYAFR